jgi:hypothetical protein
MKMSRRSLLAGVGAAGGLLAMPELVVPGLASAAATGPGLPGVPGPTLGPLANVTLTPGLTYSIQDATEWSAQGGFRVMDSGGAQPQPLGPASGLFMPIRMPVGATLKEVTVPYINTAATSMALDVERLDAGGVYTIVTNKQLVPGTGVQTATVTFTNEPKTDGSQSYMAFVENITAGTQFLQAARIGYQAPPLAFVANTVVPRVLDTRIMGGKLNPNEERIVPTRVPGSAAAAVINLTITETENAGFVAVFAANVAWPGNSNINWSQTDQNLANGVVTAVDPSGAVKIRGGVNRTHVVIDVQGYFV